MSMPPHVPVLLEEALEFLNVRPNGVFVDATLGLGVIRQRLPGDLAGGAG